MFFAASACEGVCPRDNRLHCHSQRQLQFSAILSRLLTKCGASGNAKALALVKKLSAAAWRHHIHLNGHYPFRGDGQLIDLDAIVAGLELG